MTASVLDRYFDTGATTASVSSKAIDQIQQHKQLITDCINAVQLSFDGEDSWHPNDRVWLTQALTRRNNNAEWYRDWIASGMIDQPNGNPNFVPGRGILGGGSGNSNNWVVRIISVYSELDKRDQRLFTEGLKQYIQSVQLGSTVDLAKLTQIYIAIIMLGRCVLSKEKNI